MPVTRCAPAAIGGTAAAARPACAPPLAPRRCRRRPHRPSLAARAGEDDSWEGWQDWAGPPPPSTPAEGGGEPGAAPPGEGASPASTPPPPSPPGPPSPSPSRDPNAGWDAPIYRRPSSTSASSSSSAGGWGTWLWGGGAGSRARTTPDGRPGPARPPRRAPTARGPRDEFMRPIADAVGVRLRLGPDPGAAEDEYGEEALANAAESAAGAGFAAALLAIPLSAGFVAGHVIGLPALEVARAKDPRVLAPTPRQRGEGGRALREHEVRLRMEAAIGRSPPLTDDQYVAALRSEAARLDASFRARNEKSLVRLISDTVGGATLGVMLVAPSPGRTAFFGAVGRVFSGLSDMAKAFLIIASTDIFLGYHSEEGWKALAHVVTSYYGLEVGEGQIYAFVAVVPVVADAFFKLWIFKGLNRANPGAAVTLKQMDRH